MWCAHLHLELAEAQQPELRAVLQVVSPLSLSISSKQLRLSYEFANSLSAALSSLTPQSKPASTPHDPLADKPDWRASVEASIPEGVELTFYRASLRRLPLLSFRLSQVVLSLEGSLHERDGAMCRSEFGAQLLIWSRAAQAWEPLVERTPCVLLAQNQGADNTSVFAQCDALALTLSEAMIRSLLSAHEAFSRVFSAPSLALALSQHDPEIELQVYCLLA